MARPATITDDVLIAKLSEVFRDAGYDGASLARLAAATGLQKASLYHRFPGGKDQMADAVLRGAEEWLGAHVLTPLSAPGDPRARVRAVARALDEFYAGGRQACLLNLLASPPGAPGPLADRIRGAFQAFIDALTAVLRDAGFDAATARARAERAVVLVQGSLVLARGLNTPRPFRTVLRRLEDELLSADQVSPRSRTGA